MAEYVATNKMQVGKIYYLKSAANLSRALNVWCSTAYPAANLSNVCLWDYDTEDNAQKWMLTKSGTHYLLKPLVNLNESLDLYTGSGVGQGINAHLYIASNTSWLTFESVPNTDFVTIRLESYPGKALTANPGSNGTRTGTASSSAGNVYFSDYSSSINQRWLPIEVNSGSGYRINGVDLPLAEWPVGSYWTTDGTPNGSSLEHNGIECAGFARYVYNRIWESDTYGNVVSARTLNGDSTDFLGINIGARINCDRRKSKNPSNENFNTSIGNHSMVLLGKTGTEVTVYEANHTDDPEKYCIIGVRTITFQDFYLEYINIKNTSYTP